MFNASNSEAKKLFKICYKQFGKIEETSVHFESHCSFYSFQFGYKNSKMVLPSQKQKLLDVLTYVFSFDRNAKMQDAEFLSICKWMTWWASQSYDLFFRVEVSNISTFQNFRLDLPPSYIRLDSKKFQNFHF